MTAPLRDRFGVIHHLEFYTEDELKPIIKQSAKILGVKIDPERGDWSWHAEAAGRRDWQTGF